MGYTHYLHNKSRKHYWFSDEEWETFNHKASQLIHKWFNTCEPVVYDKDFTSEFFFSGPKTNSVNSASFLEKNMNRSEWWNIDTNAESETVFFCKAEESTGCMANEFQCCKTNYADSTDTLVVALYKLAETVTGGRIKFTSDGNNEDLKTGLQLLSSVSEY